MSDSTSAVVAEPTTEPKTEPMAEPAAGPATQQLTHFADSFGPVCRAYGEDPSTTYDYREVTCSDCRHAAPYISAVPEHLKPRTTRTRRRSWPRSMQERA